MAAVVREDSGTYDVTLLELRNDFVFKSFFTDERNNRLLLHFVNSILDDSIESLRLMDPLNRKRHAADKLSIMDLLAVTDQGEQINIEMQVERHNAFNERMLFYWSSLYSSQIRTSDSYGQLRKVIQIIISDFEMLPESGIHSTFQLTDNQSGILFSNHLEIHVIQLPHAEDKPADEMDELEKWLLFFKGNQKKKEEISMENSPYKEAFEEIRKLSMDPDTVHLAISREIALRDHIQRLEDAEKAGNEIGLKKGLKKGLEEGLEKGLEVGVQKGREQAKKQLVLKMHAESLPLSLICKITELPAEEVKEIIKQGDQPST